MSFNLKNSLQGLNFIAGMIGRLVDNDRTPAHYTHNLSINFSDLLNESETSKDLSLMDAVKYSSEQTKKEELKIENTDNNKDKNNDIDDINQQAFLKGIITTNNIYAFDFELEKRLDLDKIEFSKKDLEFFDLFTQNTNLQITDINKALNQVNFMISNQSGNVSYKSFDFSKSLSSLIEYAYTVKRPIRLDFQGHSSVILKIDKEGKLSAEFMSADKAMEQILKNTIPNLRSKLDAEGLPYKEISYKNNSNKKKNQKQQQENS